MLAVLPTIHAGTSSKVTVDQQPGGEASLIVNSQPFFIKGVGGYQYLDTLKEMGGDSIRTWSPEAIDETINGQRVGDYCADNGIFITLGIWIAHERHGFNYSDKKMVQEQRDKVRSIVRKYKDEPALLMWGLGNEMEGPTNDGADPRIWKELNELAKIVKQEDPNHPVMTVIAGAGTTKVKAVKQYYPEIDVLGVNAYGGAAGVGAGLVSSGWEKPFVLTEFGPVGHWEVRHTEWGAPIEATSLAKAASYFATQRQVMEDGQGLCLGSYAFLWGHKQETTATWYGMFLASGERLSAVDAMAYAWTGEFPANRAPKLKQIVSAIDEKRVAGGITESAEAIVEDPDGDPLDYEWVVVAESTDRREGGDDEAAPPSFPGLTLSTDGNRVTFKTPRKSGPYRLFLTIRDGHGNAATANIPFYVN